MFSGMKQSNGRKALVVERVLAGGPEEEVFRIVEDMGGILSAVHTKAAC